MKYVTILCVALMLSACGVSMNVNGKVYPTYGIVNEKVNKSSKMCYEVSIGNVVWSVILVRTIVAPIYFIGWSLFNPVSVKGEKGCDVNIDDR
jgi:hypothetical protein